MRAFLRRRFWMVLSYRLGVLGIGLAYLLAALEIPLPVFVHKESSHPFPCQNHACGCQTAEQCWSQCCCFTPEERWAWAKAHHVEPPAYAEKPVEKPLARGWNSVKLRDRDRNATATNCCCGTKAEQAACCKQTADNSAKASSASGDLGGATIITVWRCHGYSTLWISTGAVLPIARLAAWSPDWVPPTSVVPRGVKADQVPSTPLDPPPRLSLV